MLQAEQNHSTLNSTLDSNHAEKKKKPVLMETLVLDMTLTKVGGLLALGFGEAGSEIISKNIINGQEVNQFQPGQKTICIFGSCTINNYTIINRVLEV